MFSITTENNLDLARHHSAAKMIKILTVLEVLLQDIVNKVYIIISNFVFGRLYAICQPVLTVIPVNFLLYVSRKGHHVSISNEQILLLWLNRFEQTWNKDCKPGLTYQCQALLASLKLWCAKVYHSKLNLFCWGEVVGCVLFEDTSWPMCCAVVKRSSVSCTYMLNIWAFDGMGKLTVTWRLHPLASSLASSPCTLNNSLYSMYRSAQIHPPCISVLLYGCVEVCERDQNIAV